MAGPSRSNRQAEKKPGEKGRLAAVNGVYMPGRDGAGIVDAFGWVMVLGALLSVCLHGLGRIFTNSNGNGRKEG